MRKLSTTFLILAVLLLSLGLVIGTTGCGAGDTATAGDTAGTGAVSSTSPSSGDTSAEDILAKAVAASRNITSLKGSFEMGLTFDIDSATLPEQEKALVGQPMKISGTLAYAEKPQAADLSVQASIAGQDLNIGLRILGNKAWIGFMNQWYEAPPELTQALSQSASQSTSTTDIQKMLSDLGVDLKSWMKDLRIAGEETVNGTTAYHLAASPDVAKMISDIFGLMENGRLMEMVDPSGSMEGLMGSGSSLPSSDDLKLVQDQLASMLKDVSADLWVAKDTFNILKFSAGAKITPPPGEDPAGVNAVNLNATVALDGINQPVTVDQPASVKPWTDLQNALQEMPGLFMGPFSSELSGASSAAPVYQ